MSQVKFKGSPVNTKGTLPQVGSKAPDFSLTGGDLSQKTLGDFAGKKLILNIFPSMDTGTCAASVRKFNEKASGLENTIVLCVSKDLPFAQGRFCTAEGLENVVSLSEYKNSNFSDAYGVKFIDGPLEGLLSRAIVVLDEHGNVIYTEQVEETVEEPNYDAALAVL
ncbi:thiol peroxidase [Sphingobacterium lumbrici]|uniref:thiol peroxidase n=1 Tax=Sphingobacterium lumbrici TaxID=2559600 RepID=UPI001128E427|nr:thiol peroxidase [Sphingobacterium lumbrici]